MNTLTRRRFLTAATLVAGTPTLQSCSTSDAANAQAVARTWRPFDRRIAERGALQRELVRYATLAPSSHNTQCWRFKLDERRIAIYPDLARRCPAVDPDDHHLFVSLGCATENLVQAARARGLPGNVGFDRPLRPTELRALEIAAQGSGVRILLLTGRSAMERVLEYVVQGNTAQMSDPAFMEELRRWIRFNDAEAIAKGDGLSSHASGNPSAPSWLGRLVFKLAFTPKSENDRYARFIRSSAGIAVFVSDTSDERHWIETGRCYERFVLQATAMGVRTAMVNQPVEVSALRPSFAQMLGVGHRRPDLVVRFGRGPEMPRSMRRAVEAVIVS